MNEEILTIAESVSNEKDLPKETIFEAIELALASAAKKKFSEKCQSRLILIRKQETTRHLELGK